MNIKSLIFFMKDHVVKVYLLKNPGQSIRFRIFTYAITLFFAFFNRVAFSAFLNQYRANPVIVRINQLNALRMLLM